LQISFNLSKLILTLVKLYFIILKWTRRWMMLHVIADEIKRFTRKHKKRLENHVNSLVIQLLDKLQGHQTSSGASLRF